MKTKKFYLLPILAANAVWVMMTALIAPALPRMETHFHGLGHTAFDARFVLVLASLVVAIASPMMGVAMHRLRPAWWLNAGVLTIALFGAVPFLTDRLDLIYGSRILVGCGAAAIMIASVVLIPACFPPAERAAVFGFQSAVLTMAGVVWYVAGGVLADVGWRWPFAAYTLAAGALLFTWPLRAPQAGDVPRELGLGLRAGVLGRPQTLLVFTLAFFIMVAIFMVPLNLPFLLRDELGIDRASVAGATMAVSTVFNGVVAFFYGRIRAVMGRLACLAWGLGLFAAGYGVVWLSGSLAPVWVAMVLVGAGLGLIMPTVTDWTVARAPGRSLGAMVGLLHTAYFLGQWASPLVVNPIADRLGLSGAFLVVGACAGAGAAMAVWVHVGRRRVTL